MSTSRLGLLLHRFADRVVAASSFVASVLARDYGVESKIVHCGLPDTVFDSFLLEKPQDARLRVVSVGRLIPKKGFDVLIRAVGVLESRGIEVDVQIVGAGPCMAELRQLSSSLGLGSRIEFTGAASRAHVLNLIDDADCLVLASRPSPDGDIDGIPVVLMEAMARRRLVLSTPVGGITELIEHGVTGLLAEPGDPVSFADNLELVASEPGYAACLINRGYSYVSTNFRLSSEVQHLVATFDELRSVDD
ncbi:glycosyltransferase family 4 protein [Gordonia sp. AC31]|uniref:glycosyltransferase family 4 protein n=1 Tax=Gordonia sp. AC31 TaxID=2962571 RepID=UPI0037BE811C